MKSSILNRSVVTGAVVYGVLNFVFTVVLFAALVLLIWGGLLTMEILAPAVALWALPAFVCGYLVSRASMKSVDATLQQVTGGIAFTWGIAAAALAQIPAILLGFTSGMIVLMWFFIVLSILAGGIGGALAFLLAGKRKMLPNIAASAEISESAPRTDE